MLASGLAAHALDGAGDGQGCQDAARRAAHGGRHGGDTGLALAHGLCPAASAHLGEHGRVEGGPVQAAVQAVGFLPGQQDLGGRPGAHGQGGADGDGVAQAHFAFGCRNAHAVVALPAEELGGFLRVVAQGLQDGHRGLEKTVFPGGGGQFLKAGTKDEAALHVAGDHTVIFEGHGQTVSGRACEPGAGHELCERSGSRFESAEDQRCLVEDANATGCLLFHTTI